MRRRSDGPSQNARQHFADHGRLSDRAEQFAQESASHDDRRERQQDVQERVWRGSRARAAARRRSYGRRRRSQRRAVAANEKKERDAAQHHAGVGGDRRQPDGCSRRQFSVHNANVDTSFTNTRFPEMTGCVQVSDSATL